MSSREDEPSGGFDPSQPLSERERQQIARLFAEPMEFPLSFRTWVKTYIESVGIQLPRSAIVGLKTTTAMRDLPRGVIFLMEDGDLPQGVREFSRPGLHAPPGMVWVVTVGRPEPVQESEEI